jgi:plasmid stabilization system protein ParE
MYEIIFTDLAKDDLKKTALYIADVLQAPTAADNLVNETERKVAILSDMPNIYPAVPDAYLARKGLRFMVVKNYMLFYIVKDAEQIVSVIRFLYGKSDWKFTLKQMDFGE